MVTRTSMITSKKDCRGSRENNSYRSSIARRENFQKAAQQWEKELSKKLGDWRKKATGQPDPALLSTRTLTWLFWWSVNLTIQLQTLRVPVIQSLGPRKPTGHEHKLVAGIVKSRVRFLMQLKIHHVKRLMHIKTATALSARIGKGV
ncbi:hypothetical protein TNCV_659741 [Trichonephila clavipes]|nr:hypothetical protein TNCV_659741 [Trichonephila clavipes]